MYSIPSFRTTAKGYNVFSKISTVIYESEEKDKNVLLPLKSIHSDIEFVDVVFSLPNKNEVVLKELSLTLSKGKTTALICKSNDEKSAIVQLLLGFYLPKLGSIRVNERSLYAFSIPQYRRRIGYVGKEPFLLEESIKNNMLNSKVDATDEEIWRVLQVTKADFEVAKFKKTLNTIVRIFLNSLKFVIKTVFVTYPKHLFLSYIFRNR